jgi:hypothetical protein
LRLILGGATGRALQERIGLSLMHPRGRVDIPVAAIQRIEALETMTFYDRQTASLSTAHCPRVEIWLDAHLRARIYRLTRRIIDEPLDIVVDGGCVSRPIVREPLARSRASGSARPIWPRRRRWRAVCARAGAAPICG